jgi:hypothetical protein
MGVAAAAVVDFFAGSAAVDVGAGALDAGLGAGAIDAGLGAGAIDAGAAGAVDAGFGAGAVDAGAAAVGAGDVATTAAGAAIPAGADAAAFGAADATAGAVDATTASGAAIPAGADTAAFTGDLLTDPLASGVDTFAPGDLGVSGASGVSPVASGGTLSDTAALTDTADSSIFTGETPTDVPNPVPDATVAPAGTSGGGITDALSKISGKDWLAGGALGLNATSMVMQAKQNRSASSQLNAAAKPISDQAAALLAQYGKGQLNPEDEYGINQWEQQQIAKAQSFYGQAGQGNSTASNKAIADIQAQAQAMRDKALTGLLQAGLQASGMALGPLTAAIEAQSKDDAAFAASEANALRALMMLNTGGTTTTTTPGGP